MNELSYPSHIGAFAGGGDELSIGLLRGAYASHSIARDDASSFLGPLLRLCDVDPWTFLMEVPLDAPRSSSFRRGKNKPRFDRGAQTC